MFVIIHVSFDVISTASWYRNITIATFAISMMLTFCWFLDECKRLSIRVAVTLFSSTRHNCYDLDGFWPKKFTKWRQVSRVLYTWNTRWCLHVESNGAVNTARGSGVSFTIYFILLTVNFARAIESGYRIPLVTKTFVNSWLEKRAGFLHFFFFFFF